MTFLSLSLAIQSGQVIPSNGMIEHSFHFKKSYFVKKDPGNSGALIVKGNHILIDFGHTSIYGNSSPSSDLDENRGYGIVLDGCEDVTIKNLQIIGFKYNIYIKNSKGIRLENVDASYSNAIPILKDGKESDTFLDVRHVGAWDSYGAGIRIDNSSDCYLTKVRASDAQNGLLLINSHHNTVIRSDFSFNSGWGIALFGSSENAVNTTASDFCNRPWAGGWGGDSAGIVVAGGSNENSFVSDSFTHSGDGFFLTDSVNGGFDGKDQKFHFDGGSNNNKVIDCDGSYASANAFECTFSQGNKFYNDLATNSEYGYWTGFSDDTVIMSCQISNNNSFGISQGQGSRTLVSGCKISQNKSGGIRFWSDAGPADNQKPCQDHILIDNSGSQANDVSISNASATLLGEDYQVINKYGDPNKVNLTKSKLNSGKMELAHSESKVSKVGWEPYRTEDYPAGKEWLQASTYAPLDFRDHSYAVYYPNDAEVDLYLLKPKISISVPPTLKFLPSSDPRIERISTMPDMRIFGAVVPYEIQFSTLGRNNVRKEIKSETLIGTLYDTPWKVKWFNWTPSELGYSDTINWQKLFASEATSENKASYIDTDYTGRSPVAGKISASHYAMMAEAEVKVQEGSISFRTISSDGIRLYLDGREVIDRWNQHPTTSDEVIVPVQAGYHKFRLEYCQEDGNARIAVKWNWTKS